MSGTEEITRLLADWGSGNQAALDKLLPLIYEELHRVASSYMRRERSHHILQTTALVHEAYLRLVDQQNANYQSRTHFFAVAAQVMRHILVDYARQQRRVKRGDGQPVLALTDAAVISRERADEVIAINTALENLSTLDPRKGKVFEMRYFGGMSVEEAADALKVSPVTVARDWRMAKAWLKREIVDGSHHAT
jgi:RNA polymerase sigma factor (TIGR02999 family)